MDIALALRAFYLLGATSIILANANPVARQRFINYGARDSSNVDVARKDAAIAGEQTSNVASEATQTVLRLSRLFDVAARWRVPHAWFIHFYVLSCGLSLLWALQFAAEGRLLGAIIWLSTQSATPRSRSMTMPRVTLAWAMLAAQGTRRLAECVWLNREPKQQRLRQKRGPPENSDEHENAGHRRSQSSTMWVGHWAAGLAFYTTTSVAVWAEGLSAIVAWDGQLRSLVAAAPSLRSALAVFIFIIASGAQHDCHAFLASLRRQVASRGYQLPWAATEERPGHAFFQAVVCPHYLCECLIYLALALAAAPTGCMFNATLACAAVFVAINLGVTADGTRQWYARNFGRAAVEGRWRMLPGVW